MGGVRTPSATSLWRASTSSTTARLPCVRATVSPHPSSSTAPRAQIRPDARIGAGPVWGSPVHIVSSLRRCAHVRGRQYPRASASWLRSTACPRAAVGPPASPVVFPRPQSSSGRLSCTVRASLRMASCCVLPPPPSHIDRARRRRLPKLPRTSSAPGASSAGNLQSGWRIRRVLHRADCQHTPGARTFTFACISHGRLRSCSAPRRSSVTISYDQLLSVTFALHATGRSQPPSPMTRPCSWNLSRQPAKSPSRSSMPPPPPHLRHPPCAPP